MKDYLKKLHRIGRGPLIFLVVILICSAGLAAFLNCYFKAYGAPYLKGDLFDLSLGWQYRAGQADLQELDSLKTGPNLPAGQTLTLYKTLDIELAQAAVLIRANHQSVNVYLDDTPLYLDRALGADENPGMALHFITLPDNYLHKTLKIETTSPYALYSGRTSPVLLGTVPTLEAYALSRSMRSVILMAMCLALGGCTIALTFIRALAGSVQWEHLAIGVFAVIWALYYVCTEYIVFQFFSPAAMSYLSLGLYFSFQVPLTLFFYFAFEHYQKWLLPAVIIHGAFVAAAFILQLLGIMDLPQLLNVNNTLLAGLIYTIVLAVLEARKKNRMMMLAAPFLIIAYLSMLYNFSVFYTRHGTVPYTYRDTYFLLILAVLIYNVLQFFSAAYHRQRENEVLSLQNRLAKESYEQIKAHLKEVGGLKHDIRNHLAAMRMYLDDGRVEEARTYLKQYTDQAGAITEAVYHDHYLVNAILGKLLRSAADAGVKVELNLKTASVHIADPDLYSLLFNILENALEACAAMPEGRERFIQLTIARREPYLNICCKNSMSGEVIRADGKIQTGKLQAGHGYGLWTIERIVDAYNGIMDIDYDQNTFTLTAALKDPKQG